MPAASRIEVKFEKPGVKKVSAAWVKKIVHFVLRAEKSRRRSVSVYLTGDPEIRRINRRFLRHDYATDVISFWSEPENLTVKEADYLGDLVVSVETARSASRRLKLPFRQELARYLVHGTLHLLGYDDKKKKDFNRMHQRQEQIVTRVTGRRPMV